MQSSKVQFRISDFSILFAIVIALAVVAGVWHYVGPVFAEAASFFDTTNTTLTTPRQ